MTGAAGAAVGAPENLIRQDMTRQDAAGAVVTTDVPTGLTSAEVAERVAAGLVNRTKDAPSRTLAQILRGNLFTLFNAILAVAIVVVLLVGDWRDAVFGLVIVVNAAIGVVQEYRAKRTLDALALVDAHRVRVRRDGVEADLDTGDLVQDDVYRVRTGDQVPTDAVVLAANSAEFDESLLTGESDPVPKAPGDRAMSGSFVVAGSALLQAHGVGADAYANRLTAQARRFSLVSSELRQGINRILIWITWIIGPVIIALLWSQVRARGGWSQMWADGSWRPAVVKAVAGVVGMIPEGLVLLTSISFGLAAITLARRQVLVQELPAVEVLARVDVVCLDKTGTLTLGDIAFDAVVPLGPEGSEGAEARAEVDAVLDALAADPAANATAAALLDRRPADDGGAAADDDPAASPVASPATVPVAVTYDVPFSSARKWSALSVAGEHWVFGGPDVVLAGASSPAGDDSSPAGDDTGDRLGAAAGAALDRAAAAQADGARALVLARAASVPTADAPLPPVRPVALVLFRERIRPDAAQTLAYFAEQGVSLRIISGDNPVTVAAIAHRVGLAGAEGYDARKLPEDEAELAEVLEHNVVFGRVTPEQKRAMVHALQSRGHTVAMTGDGVNDALALKDADLGIAMGSGADVTKAVARLVLLDGQFSRLPGVVAEGRRVIANVERVANLFLTKTTYAVLLAVAVSLLGWPYPFLPRHLSVVGALTIGIPAFFLALAPNARRYRPGFLHRVLALAMPSGAVAAVVVLSAYGWARESGHAAQAEPVATLTLLIVGLWLLGCLARPWVWWRVALVAAMGLGVVLVLSVPFLSDFYALSWPHGAAAVAVLVAGGVGAAGVEVVFRRVTPWLTERWDAAPTKGETSEPKVS